MVVFSSISRFRCIGVAAFPFFFNDTATTEIYTYGHTLSLHDALPISGAAGAEDVTDVHVGAPASNASGSRATLMNSSSSDATPCSAGSRRGSPCSNTRPCETNSTRSQTASTSYMLCEVQRMPQTGRASGRERVCQYV